MIACDNSCSEQKTTVAQNEPNASATQQSDGASHQSTPVRYGVKEGQIKYTYNGIQNGKEVVYFTDYGMTEIKFTETSRDNVMKEDREQISLITLMKDSMIYVLDRNTMNAKSLDNAILYENAQQSESLDLDEVAKKMYRSKGGTMKGLDTIIGLPAEFWDVPEMQTKEWRWKGIMLKTMVQLPRSHMLVEAVSIDTTTPVDPALFELPDNANVSEGTSMAKWMESISKPIEREKVFDFSDSTKGYNVKGELVPIESLRVD